MSSCKKNASESNNKTPATTSVLNEEFNNDQQTAKTFGNNETLDQIKNNEQQQQNIVYIDDAANIETVKDQNENATTIKTTATIVTSTIMLPQSTDIVATATEKETAATTDANIIKKIAAVDEVSSTTAVATAISPIINAAIISTAKSTETTATAAKSVGFNLFQHQGQSASDNVATAATTLSPTTAPPHAAAAATAPHLPHIASEPTFGIMLRRNQRQQQKNLKIHHDTNQPETASSLLSSPSPLIRDNIATTSSGIRSGSVSASASPSMVRKTSECSVLLPRRVSFPKSDNELVTGYLEPANPWEHAFMVKSISEIAEIYVMSCQKHNTKPLQVILDHLKIVELNKTLRQPTLSLKSIKMAPSDCEALEEVFKRVQYKAIDLSLCQLNETAASALFEMIEYYEATNELDISSNAEGMTHRGWTSCTYMISHSRALQVLNAQGNPISKTGAKDLGHAMCTSNLHTIKLEHCGLKGTPLSSLCFELRDNRILKELWLAHNDLDCDDASTIAKLLTVNHYLQLVDISNNNIRDEGLKMIVKALITQTRELEKRSLLPRTSAIDDDDCGSLSPVETTSHLDFSTRDAAMSSCGTNGKYDNIASNNTNSTRGLLDSDASQSEDTDDDAFETAKKTTTNDDSLLVLSDVKAAATVGLSNATTTEDSLDTTTTATVTATTRATLTPAITSTTVATTAMDDLDADDDTEDTVKSSNMPKNNTATQSANGGGQSMLDKLLSMNSTDSSSDEAASNLSTDTIAACCSEDASLISDDIFDATIATTITTATATTNTSTNSNVTTMKNLHSPTPMLEIKSSPAATFHAEAASTATGATQNQQKMLHGNDKISGDRADATNGGNDNSNAESSNGSSSSSGINSSNNNNNNNNTSHHQLQHSAAIDDDSSLQTSGIFEVTAEENDCLISTASSNDDERLSEHHASLLLQHSTKALDVNKNTKLIDDFDDTHSTDSAFESASEGDISRNLPEEFGRLSTSFESTRIDESATTKDLGSIETATIATESTECLVAATTANALMPTPPPIAQLPPLPPLVKIATQMCSEVSSRNSPPTPTLGAAVIVAAVSPIVAMKTLSHEGVDDSSVETELNTSTSSLSSLPPLSPHPPPKVTIAEDTLHLSKSKMSITSPSPTPPPPSNSPGGVSVGMRRTESSCGFITPSTRHRSQSSDSLCSDNSLDGSNSSDINFSTSTQINEKLAKNDTLTRQQRQFETPAESNNKAPCGLKALALWNNNLTKESGAYVAELLAETGSLELLNIGKNCLSNDFVSVIKDSLVRNTTLTTLGLQSAHLSAKGIETLSSILTFGGNSTLQRIDIRDNKLEVESLSTLAEVLKSNTTVTQIDIDDEPKRLSVGNDAHLDYARVLENVRSMCSRNEKTQSQLQAADKSSLANVGRRRGGYYLGSRKISLTCHSRPVVVDNAAGGSGAAVSTSSSTTMSNSKLDVKRKTGARLRSPVPSPPTVSPSSSPSRSRFKVFRVNEVSPLTSPMATTPSPSPPPATAAATSSCSVAIQTNSTTNSSNNKIQSTSLPTSSSMMSMSSVTSSTQSIKRHSTSPRSRFQVSKIYEDQRVPLANRALPPITPPLNAPPTPMLKSSSSSLSTCVPTNPIVPIVVNAEKADVTDLSHTPNVDSTKQMTTRSSTTSTPISHKTTLSPISSVSSTSSSPSSSSSSSTSPASLSSNSSIISSSSTSSSSSTALFGSSDETDNSTNQPANVVTVPSGARCPIAVFDENDITLTSVNNILSSSSSAPAPMPAALESKEGSDGTHDVTLTAALNETAITPQHPQQEQEQQQPLQQRARKTSWYGNPAAVDKLLTLFQNPGTIFQRSLSPESSLVAASAVTVTSPPTTFAAQAHNTAAVSQPNAQQSQNSLVSTRKCSPSSWSKLGNEMMRPVTNALQQTTAVSGGGDTTNIASTLVTAANTVALEQSKTFLDAASKQFCDFSKQVFRQNLSFGNESNAAALTSSTAAGIVTPIMISNNGSSVIGGGEQHDAAHIPSDVKLEIKENISPEHTINDETLKSLQKICPATSTATTAVVAVTAAPIAATVTTAVETPMSDVLKMDTEEIKEQLCSSLTPTASTTSTSLQQEEQLTKTQTSS